MDTVLCPPWITTGFKQAENRAAPDRLVPKLSNRLRTLSGSAEISQGTIQWLVSRQLGYKEARTRQHAERITNAHWPGSHGRKNYSSAQSSQALIAFIMRSRLVDI